MKIYGVGGQFLEGIRAFYRGASGCVKVNDEFNDSFSIGMGVRQGCVMSPWLFNIYMDGSMREIKARVDVGSRLMGQNLTTLL